jgi:large subunit ribosomal protein L29
MKNSIKDLTYDELLVKRDELKKRLLEVRFKKIVGHMDNPLEKRTLRRDIARLNTIIHEYGLRIRES